MNCNVGGADRIVRVLVGIALLVIGFVVPMSGAWQVAAFVVGAVLLVTVLVRFCPLNRLVGINTCPKSPQEG